MLERALQSLKNDRVFGRLLSNTGWLLGANTIAIFFTFAQGILVARILGVDQYGVFTIITAYASIVNQFVDSRVWEACIKYVNQFLARGEIEKAKAIVKLCYGVDALTGGITFLIVLLTAGWAAQQFAKDAAVANLFQLFALATLIDIPFGTCSALLRIANQFNWLSYHKAGTAALKLAGVLFVSLFQWGITEILLMYLGATLIGNLIVLAISQRVLHELGLTAWLRTPVRALGSELGTVLHFVLFSNLGATSRLVTSKIDILVLSWFGSPSAVGLYKLARVIADPLSVLIGALYVAIYPELARLASQGNFQKMRSLQKKISVVLITLIVPIGLLLTWVVSWAIPILYGEQFIGAVLLAQIMVWQIIWIPLIWVPGTLLSLGHVRVAAGVNWLDAINYLILLFVLVPPLGALGAALATLLRFILWTGMASVVVFRVNLNSPQFEAT